MGRMAMDWAMDSKEVSLEVVLDRTEGLEAVVGVISLAVRLGSHSACEIFGSRSSGHIFI